LRKFDRDNTLPLRGFLALGIIFHHLAENYEFGIRIGNHTVSIINLFVDMGTPIVSIFFFMTGYGLAFSLRNKGNDYLKGFIPSRLGKILPEFLVLSVISILIFHNSLSDVAIKLIHGNPPLHYSWFIYAIIYAYIAFYISACICHAKTNITLVFFSAIIVFYIAVLKYIEFGGWWFLSAPALVIGYIAAAYEPVITKLMSKKTTIVAIIVFAIISVSFNLLTSRLDTLISFVTVILVYCLTRVYGMPRWGWLLFLGDISLNLYLIHGIFLNIFLDYIIDPYIALLTVLSLSVLGAHMLLVMRKKGDIIRIAKYLRIC